MLAAFPRTVIPLIVFNVVGFGLGGDPWRIAVPQLAMPSGVAWGPTLGDIVVVIAVVVLVMDVLRAARVPLPLAYHAAAVTVLAAHVAEFLVIGAAATSVFFVLTVIAFADTATVTALSIRAAKGSAADIVTVADPPPEAEPPDRNQTPPINADRTVRGDVEQDP